MNKYKGYKYCNLSNNELTQFYNGKLKPDEIGLLENEYLIITDKNDEVIDFGVKKGNKILKVGFSKLGDRATDIIKPRNPEQYCAFHMLKDQKTPIKLITGRFGTGKSLACIAAALEMVNKGYFDNITFIRNNVQVKDTDKLGALPGEMSDKYLPYVMPFADHVGNEDGVQQLVEERKLKVVPLAFLRGRSIRNSIIYSMESENLTKEHIQLIMGRVDRGSELWMDGDIKQRDKTSFERSQGLETMINRLKGNSLFGYIHLEKSERSKIASLADLLD